MRLVPFVALLLFLMSCGQNGRSSSASNQKSLCDLNGSSVECSAIEGADGLGIDLLDAIIDVPIKVVDQDITFLTDKTASSVGRRITCKASVRNSEIYRFALRGEKLLLMTEQGSFEFDRISDGVGLSGAWTWKGYVDQGMHLRKNVTFIDNTRMVLRHHCEL